MAAWRVAHHSAHGGTGCRTAKLGARRAAPFTGRCPRTTVANALPQQLGTEPLAVLESSRAHLQQLADRLTAMYVLADVNSAVASTQAAAEPASQRAGGVFAPLADGLESVLKVLQGGLDQLHVPHSYGYSIILLTLIVKTVTFPLTKKQVESAMAVQSLKPRVDLIKQRFGDDKDKIQKETSILYEQAGVNPLAGCLPALATIPIFIGLFQSLSNVANEGAFESQGFYWIPSLAGPTTLAMRQSGLGTSWLFPFVDGAPPLGWDGAIAYLSLPVALVLAQYASNAITSPPIDPKDEGAGTARALMLGLPLMIGWFALNVPSGLSLYYMANTLITSAQQIYLKKLGGANVVINDLGPVTKPGSGRRQGKPVGAEFTEWVPQTVMTTVQAKAKAEAEAAAAEAAQEAADEAAASGASYSFDGDAAPAAAAPAAAEALLDPAKVDRRCKRKRLSLLAQPGSGLATA